MIGVRTNIWKFFLIQQTVQLVVCGGIVHNHSSLAFPPHPGHQSDHTKRPIRIRNRRSHLVQAERIFMDVIHKLQLCCSTCKHLNSLKNIRFQRLLTQYELVYCDFCHTVFKVCFIFDFIIVFIWFDLFWLCTALWLKFLICFINKMDLDLNQPIGLYFKCSII